MNQIFQAEPQLRSQETTRTGKNGNDFAEVAWTTCFQSPDGRLTWGGYHGGEWRGRRKKNPPGISWGLPNGSSESRRLPGHAIVQRSSLTWIAVSVGDIWPPPVLENGHASSHKSAGCKCARYRSQVPIGRKFP